MCLLRRLRGRESLVNENNYTEKLERVIEVDAAAMSDIHMSSTIEDEADTKEGNRPALDQSG